MSQLDLAEHWPSSSYFGSLEMGGWLLYPAFISWPLKEEREAAAKERAHPGFWLLQPEYSSSRVWERPVGGWEHACSLTLLPF